MFRERFADVSVWFEQVLQQHGRQMATLGMGRPAHKEKGLRSTLIMHVEELDSGMTEFLGTKVSLVSVEHRLNNPRAPRLDRGWKYKGDDRAIVRLRLPPLHGCSLIVHIGDKVGAWGDWDGSTLRMRGQGRCQQQAHRPASAAGPSESPSC